MKICLTYNQHNRPGKRFRTGALQFSNRATKPIVAGAIGSYFCLSR
jgi:hypothetical protein